MIAPILSISSLVTKVRIALINPYTWLIMLLFVVLFLSSINSAMAANISESGSGLPWEGPLTKISNSISGPVAFVIALTGIIACGATLIWGGEISEFTRRIIYLVMVICVIVFAKSMLQGTLFTGAVVSQHTVITIADVSAYEKLHPSILHLGGK
ncbi:MAG: TrbC/VirB2 family type IV secretion system protein [Gammaproteobacteria bacterium]